MRSRSLARRYLFWPFKLIGAGIVWIWKGIAG
jgi:hypothetical protein